jgi:molybdenum cofactor cytidylyltransferase
VIRSVAAIILAAGEGRRFGRPKALAVEKDRTFLQIAVDRILEAEFDRIAIVLGADGARIRNDVSVASVTRECESRGVHLTFGDNHDWALGRTGSIAFGLGLLPEDSRGALIHQVDFPHVAVSTYRSLAREFALIPGAEDRIFLPVHEGQRGHPIVIGRSLWAAVMAMGRDEPLRNLIRQDASRVTEVRVDDRGILRNVNTPDETAAEGEK